MPTAWSRNRNPARVALGLRGLGAALLLLVAGALVVARAMAMGG